MLPNTPDTEPDEPPRDDPHPHQPGSNEADPDKQATPAGVAEDLEEMADEMGATTDPGEAADDTR